MVVTLVGAVGGLEGVKWLFNRKRDARAGEFHLLQETVTFLQAQLKEKEERFAEQTAVVRRLNRDVLESERKISDLSLELAHKRCDDMPCPWRKPPTAYTKPPKNEGKEDYFKKRDNNK